VVFRLVLHARFSCHPSCDNPFGPYRRPNVDFQCLDCFAPAVDGGCFPDVGHFVGQWLLMQLRQEYERRSKVTLMIRFGIQPGAPCAPGLAAVKPDSSVEEIQSVFVVIHKINALARDVNQPEQSACSRRLAHIIQQHLADLMADGTETRSTDSSGN